MGMGEGTLGWNLWPRTFSPFRKGTQCFSRSSALYFLVKYPM